MRHRLILALYIVFSCFNSYCQTGFEEFKVFKSIDGEVRSISLGEYQFGFSRGKMKSFKTEDSNLVYIDSNKNLILTDRGSKYDISLGRYGITYHDADTSFLITSIKSLNPSINDTLTGGVYFFSIHNHDFIFEFGRSGIRKVNVYTKGYYVVIKVFIYYSNPEWDLYITSNKTKSFCAVDYYEANPNLLSIQDSVRKLKSLFTFSRKSRRLERISIWRPYIKDVTVGKTFRRIYFTRRGTLKKKADFFTTGIVE